MPVMRKITSGSILTALAIVFAALLSAGQADAAIDAPVSSCIDCHSKLSGSLNEPLQLWEKSVHREVGTTCDACHGGDPKDKDKTWMAHKASSAMARKIGFLGKPDEGEIPEFCGKCHVNIKDNYLESQHAEMGTPDCVTCHTSHSVQRPSLAKMREEVCSMCHEGPQIERIESMMSGVGQELERVAGLVEQYEVYLTSSVEDNLKKAETEKAAMGSIFHTFSPEKIKTQVASVEEKINDIDAEIDKTRLEVKNRKKMGIGIIIFALGVAAVLYYYRSLIPIPHD
jgi:predicted CXXCH cytochrome family protein